MLEVNVDTAKLYEGEDTYYELWICSILEKVHASRRRQDREARKG